MSFKLKEESIYSFEVLSPFLCLYYNFKSISPIPIDSSSNNKETSKTNENTKQNKTKKNVTKKKERN